MKYSKTFIVSCSALLTCEKSHFNVIAIFLLDFCQLLCSPHPPKYIGMIQHVLFGVARAVPGADEK